MMRDRNEKNRYAGCSIFTERVESMIRDRNEKNRYAGCSIFTERVESKKLKRNTGRSIALLGALEEE